MIGADGIGSVVRRHVLGERNTPGEYTGVVYIGCMVSRKEANLPSDLVLPAFIYTRSGAFLVFPVDETGENLQWSTSIKAPERARREWKSYGEQAVSRVKEEWASIKLEPIRALVDHLTAENARLWAVYQMPPMPTWHTDRTLFLGDAAHAVLPSVGQGAAQAFEDIALLSRLLAHPPVVQKGYPTLFEYFEKTRKGRTDMIRAMAQSAEISREKTESDFAWLIKTWKIWAGMKVVGVMTYVMGNKVNGYDVTEESIDVR